MLELIRNDFDNLILEDRTLLDEDVDKLGANGASDHAY
jgi:hypothetical protein